MGQHRPHEPRFSHGPERLSAAWHPPSPLYDGLPALVEKGSRPDQAELVRLLLGVWAHGVELDPWLPFPQNLCSFSFGDDNRPLPIGALRLLWSAGWPFQQTCPACGANAYIVSFGGIMTVGGGHLVCADCTREWFQWIGGFVRVGRNMEASPLQGTEYQIRHGRFGGAFSSAGAELRRVLGAREPYVPGAGVSVIAQDHGRIEMDVDFAGKISPSLLDLSQAGLRSACEAGGLTTYLDRDGDYWYAHKGLAVGAFPMLDPRRFSMMAYLGVKASTTEASELCDRLGMRLRIGTARVLGNRSEELVLIIFEHNHPLPEGELMPPDWAPDIIRRFVEAVYDAMVAEEGMVFIPSMPLRRA